LWRILKKLFQMNLHPSHPIRPLPYLPVEVRLVLWKHLFKIWRSYRLTRNRRLLGEKLRFPQDNTCSPSYRVFELERKNIILEWNIVSIDEEDEHIFNFPINTVIQTNFRYLKYEPYKNARRRITYAVSHKTDIRPGLVDSIRIIN